MWSKLYYQHFDFKPMVIWPVLASSGKTADLVLACFGRFRSQRVKEPFLYDCEKY